MECKEQDRNLYYACLRKLKQVNDYMERNNRICTYSIKYEETGDRDYCLQGKDKSGRILFVRTFTYCDRLLDYLSGMCNIIEEVEQ